MWDKGGVDSPVNPMKCSLFLAALFGILLSAGALPAGENMMENGDLSADKPGFSTGWAKESLECRIIDGKPAPKGKRCLEIELKQASPEQRTYSVSYNAPIYVDPTKKYRVRAKALVQEPCTVTCGGYAQGDKTGKPIMRPDGKGVWQYSFILINKSTTDVWQEFEATIGPAGSDCKFTWDPQTLSISMTFWIAGGPAKLYFSDFSVEEL